MIYSCVSEPIENNKNIKRENSFICVRKLSQMSKTQSNASNCTTKYILLKTLI